MKRRQNEFKKFSGHWSWSFTDHQPLLTDHQPLMRMKNTKWINSLFLLEMYVHFRNYLKIEKSLFFHGETIHYILTKTPECSNYTQNIRKLSGRLQCYFPKLSNPFSHVRSNRSYHNFDRQVYGTFERVNSSGISLLKVLILMLITFLGLLIYNLLILKEWQTPFD